LRVRPETTELECLSDASFLGKFLVLPANVRLDWKVIARYTHSSLFGLIISKEGIKFYNIDTKLDLLNLKRSPKAVFLVMCDPSVNEL
jgi:hypothetical protein